MKFCRSLCNLSEKREKTANILSYSRALSVRLKMFYQTPYSQYFCYIITNNAECVFGELRAQRSEK